MMFSYVILLLLSLINVVTSSLAMVNSTNTSDPRHIMRKPSTKPIVSTTKPVYKYPTKKQLNLKPPTVKPIYKYPSNKPVSNKVPTTKPAYKYPSRKPIYNYPTKKPIYNYPSKKPIFSPTGNSFVTVQNLGNISVESLNTTDGILELKRRGQN